MSNNAKHHFLNYKKLYTVIAVIILIMIFAFVMYGKGYRLKSNFTLGKVGAVVMEIPMPLTSIFIDESEKIVTSKDNETVRLPFSPRKHSVIVSRDGYFPWKKDFVVPSGQEIKLSPMFVSQNATGVIITKNDPEYNSLRNNIIKNLTPTKNLPKTSSDKTRILWLEDNAISVQVPNDNSSSTMQVVKIVIQPDTIVRNVDFYKDRSDVVIFSTGNAVYAIEIDTEGGQNFMPLYRGQAPNFMKTDNNYIYVLDGENLMQVVI